MSVSSQEMTKEACHMQILYCPKKSFSIPLHQMQLSENALNDARLVRSSSDAEKFLEDYSSHVSTDTYHVGGVLIKSLVMKSSTTKSLQQMLQTVSKNANLAAGADFGFFKIPGGKVDFNKSSEENSSSSEQKASDEATVEYHHTALGPRTDEEADFKARLDDKSTWDIIDKIDGSDLVPVWEIPSLKNAKDLQSCCDLLREAWQDFAKKKAAEGNIRISRLLQASYMGRIKSLLDISSASTDLTVLKDTLTKVWVIKTENLEESMTNALTKALFQLPEFHDLLRQLAESTETDSLNDGRGLLRRFISRELQDWLEGENISLNSSVQNVLRDELKVISPLPTLEDMPLGALVDRLNTLLGGLSSGAGATVVVFDNESVAKEIRDFFRQNKENDGYPVREVRSLITNHGFEENGEIRNNARVTQEEVVILVDKLKSITSGIQSSTPTDPQGVEDVVAGPVTTESSYLQTSEMLGRISHLFDLKGSIPEGSSIVYGRHMLVDRPKDSSDDPHRRMLDRIRHRLELFASTSKLADVSKRKNHFSRATGVNKDKSGDDIAKSHSTPIHSPLGILVQLLRSSDLLAQTALLQLLLNARIAIPLVVPLNTRTEENISFGHLAEALDFVRVKVAKQETLAIAEDTKLPRVVFLSNRTFPKRETSHMASKVMNFQLPSKFFKGDNGDGSTVIELGVGFLRIAGDESRDHKPCLVFCVWGDHNCLGEFLAKVADFLIVEMDPAEEASPLSWNTGHAKDQTLYWKIDPTGEGDKNEPCLTFWGSFQYIVDEIEDYLFQGIVEQKTLFKGASVSEVINTFTLQSLVKFPQAFSYSSR